MPEFNNTFRRLDKIRATMEQLHAENLALRERLRKRDESLVAKIRRQSADISSMIQHAAAQERVLKSLQDQVDEKKQLST